MAQQEVPELTLVDLETERVVKFWPAGMEPPEHWFLVSAFKGTCHEGKAVLIQHW